MPLLKFISWPDSNFTPTFLFQIKKTYPPSQYGHWPIQEIVYKVEIIVNIKGVAFSNNNIPGSSKCLVKISF